MAKERYVLTTGDVARICSVAPRTAQKWFDCGLLKGYRIPGSRHRRIPIDELIRFTKAHNIPCDIDTNRQYPDQNSGSDIAE